jgi:hypothetical protein
MNHEAVLFQHFSSSEFYSIMALQPFVGLWPLFQFLNLYAVGRTPSTEISPSQGLYLHAEQHKHRINAYRHISMLLVVFEPAIPVFERAKTVQDLDRAATVIGLLLNYMGQGRLQILQHTSRCHVDT